MKNFQVFQAEEDAEFESKSLRFQSVVLKRQARCRKLSRSEIESTTQARLALSICNQYFLDRPQ